MKHLDRGHSKDFSAHSARSYGLSNSFFGNDSNFKNREIKELSTGLKLNFDEALVQMVFKADKPSLMLNELVTLHLKKLGISDNFEQVEKTTSS